MSRKPLMRNMYHCICMVMWAGIVVLPAAEIYRVALTHTPLWFVLGIVCVLFFLRQRYFAKSTFLAATPVFVSALYVFMAFWAENTGRQGLAVLYPLLILFILTACLIHRKMAAVDESLENITRTSKQPVARILSFDARFTTVMGAVIILLALVLFFGAFAPAASAIQGWRPSMEWDGSRAEYTVQQQMPRDAFLVDIDEFAPTETPFMRVMNMLYWIVGGAVALLGLVYFVTMIFRAIIAYLRGLSPVTLSADMLDGAYEEEKNFILPQRSKEIRTRLAENEVRKQFRLTVKRHMQKGVPIQKSDTPAQISRKITTEDINALTEKYRAVRYDPVK
ncbi:MAG: DUF3488 domain-containing protein [Defluviitaleaceae bacterium]|nr:DUF3488 domain-containing protein [Defluviitaleaceae bacterium]MCL2275857.1 DUF3488 domain-containing protein [Defluviitaleaceae bacterium]